MPQIDAVVVSGSTNWGPQPVVEVPFSQSLADQTFPRPAIARSGRRALLVTLQRRGGIAATGDESHVGVRPNSSVSRRLDLEKGKHFTLETPDDAGFVVRRARADDLPRANTVYVSPARFDQLNRESRGETFLLDGRTVIPVVVKPRTDCRETDVRMSLLARLITGLEPGTNVSLVAMGSSVGPGLDWRHAQRRITTRTLRSRMAAAGASVLGLLLSLLRRLDQGLEAVLRPLLLAPLLMVRSEQAEVLDDGRSVLRAHPAVLGTLGIPAQGGQAILRWGRAQIGVLVLPTAESMQALDLERFRAVEQHETARPDGLPEHLVVRLSSTARAELEMPAHGIIVLRRRLRPLVLRQLNVILTPLVGLLLAGLAVQFGGPSGTDIRWWLWIGTPIVVFLGLAPIRLSRPGRGRWP